MTHTDDTPRPPDRFWQGAVRDGIPVLGVYLVTELLGELEALQDGGWRFAFVVVQAILLILILAWILSSRRRSYREQVAAYERRAEEQRKRAEEQQRQIELLRQKRPQPGVVEPSRCRRGLIVPVSFGIVEEIPAYDVIRHHCAGDPDDPARATLEHLWLVYARSAPPDTVPDDVPAETPSPPAPPREGKPSFDNALELQRRFTAQGVHVHLVEINHEFDAHDIYEKVDGAYKESARYNLRPDEVVADITGGTKVMSVGIALAGIPLERDLQFLKPRKHDPVTGVADRKAGSDPYLININFVFDETMTDPAGRRAGR